MDSRDLSDPAYEAAGAEANVVLQQARAAFLAACVAVTERAAREAVARRVAAEWADRLLSAGLAAAAKYKLTRVLQTLSPERDAAAVREEMVEWLLRQR
jgi:hypothetical protein